MEYTQLNKYAVAYLSLFDGVLKQEIVEAETSLEAASSYCGVDFVGWPAVYAYLGEDHFLGVMQITNLPSTRNGDNPSGVSQFINNAAYSH